MKVTTASVDEGGQASCQGHHGLASRLLLILGTTSWHTAGLDLGLVLPGRLASALPVPAQLDGGHTFLPHQLTQVIRK
jgi:hypothetical protein